MTRTEAENYVYESYLKAEAFQNYDARDSEKRRPDLTREVIRRRAGTPCVVVTGSKGKGSVANMISCILKEEYRVGLMTSPHLTDFCERFRINGRNISDEDFVKYMSFIKPEIDEIERRIPDDICVSPMGIQADLALTYFNASKTQFNVMECGKGARYDDVNNVKHEYAVINSIFLEHTRELGETQEEIAKDKAFVINGEQRCVYVASQRPEVMQVIEKRAALFHTKLKVYGRDFWAEHIRYTNQGMCFDVIVGDRVIPDLSIPLMGAYQARNCALAAALCLDVSEKISAEMIRTSLRRIVWPGRMEILSSDPFIMLDACISPESCRYVKDVMKHLGIRRAVMIIGIPDDKDYAGVAREMDPVAEKIILTRSQNPHYIFTREQHRKLQEEGIPAIWTKSLEEAFEEAGIETGMRTLAQPGSGALNGPCEGKAVKNCTEKKGEESPEESRRPVIILGTTSVVSEVKVWQNSFRPCEAIPCSRLCLR